ncbi:hypothetical protein [Candidatus Nitrosotenuis aquarius]|uniref:capsular polysaccharide export protein, LipB/KpsS family n=1 Tax=Candidatus Nitrosotenuis aquarius TaxID=1846278 RepID=UPI000C1DCA8D|nr:hypothetical protein [Candidatus Nitrosotenuis aquarius]
MKNKILFWLDQTLIQFGIAKFLYDKHECDLFAIIDVADRTKTFFEIQKLVPFKQTWFYHDQIKKINPDVSYLKKIEEKYSINLWQFAYNERIFYRFNDYCKFTEDEVLSILEQECRLYEKVLDEIKPDFVILNQPAFHHNYLFYKICKARNVNVLLLKTTRVGYKCIITDEDELLNYKQKSFTVTNRTFEELQQYLASFSIYKQATEFEEKFQKSKSGFLKSVFQFLFVSNNSNAKTHYTYYGRTKFKVLIKSIIYSLKTKYRKYYIDRNLVKDPDLNKQFIYFPLHIEQERSLLILAPYYTNQVEMIANIVQSLPIGYKLYVKEHPTMFSRGWRSISNYKQIMNLPNVELIHPEFKPNDLITNCSLVITISGTNGFDAAFYQKPSIILSDTAFSTLPSVRRVRSLEDLPSVIKESLKITVNVSDLNEYVSYIDEISFNFDLDGFVQIHSDYFYYGGSLVDVEIPETKMNTFLELEKQKFEFLASEFIKKIKNTK